MARASRRRHQVLDASPRNEGRRGQRHRRARGARDLRRRQEIPFGESRAPLLAPSPCGATALARSLLRLQRCDPGSARTERSHVGCNLLVYQARLEKTESFFVGRREDVLRRKAPGRLADRAEKDRPGSGPAPALDLSVFLAPAQHLRSPPRESTKPCTDLNTACRPTSARFRSAWASRRASSETRASTSRCGWSSADLQSLPPTTPGTCSSAKLVRHRQWRTSAAISISASSAAACGESAHMYLCVGKSIRTWEELKGKRLGLLSRGSCPEWFMAAC